MYPFFILILALAPWKPEYHQALFDLHVIVHDYPYCGDYSPGAWTLPDRAIHLCPTPGDYWPWLGLHESQHIMASTFLGYRNYDVFAKLAMQELYNGPYAEEQIDLARYYLSYGSHELHAELPWILHGELPPSLQPWYPWFQLSSGVAPSQEDASWSKL